MEILIQKSIFLKFIQIWGEKDTFVCFGEFKNFFQDTKISIHLFLDIL